MYRILLKIWKQKIKVIDDAYFFRIGSYVFFMGFAVCICIGEIYFLNADDYLTAAILNVFLIIYNKPTVLCHVVQRKNIPFMIKPQVYLKFFLFQILRENPILIPYVAAQSFVLIYSVVTMKFYFVAEMCMIAIDLYLLDIYQRENKFLILIFGICNFIGIIKIRRWQMGLLALGNALFLYCSFQKELLNTILTDGKRSVFINNRKMTILKNSTLMLLRMSFQEFFQFLFGIGMICVISQLVENNILLYLLIVIFIIEIELMQNDKMVNYDTSYGKNLFSHFVKINFVKKFCLSAEFYYGIKYTILSIVLLVVQIISDRFDLEFGFAYINFLLVLFAVAYRYYNAVNYALELRKTMEHTWFQMCMIYMILIDLSPVIFQDTLKKINGYCIGYGNVFSIIVTVILFMAKIENLIHISGCGVHEKVE